VPTKSDRSRWGRLGAYVQHSRHDPRVTTAQAREAFLLRFEREVDPHGELPTADRLRRAKAAQRAYFIRLAERSGQARRRDSAGPAPRSGA
jgi:hypothetical protein